MTKFVVMCTNPEQYLRGNYFSCLSLYTQNPGVSDWIEVGEVDIDIKRPGNEAMDIVMKQLEVELNNARKLVEAIENRKADLLCLEAPVYKGYEVHDEPATSIHDYDENGVER